MENFSATRLRATSAGSVTACVVRIAKTASTFLSFAQIWTAERKVAASAFYRKKPSVANVTILIRECALVALTQGFVVVRIFRLLLTTCFYIGRLDTPFLYNSVGHIGGYRVDGEPYMFQIDILQHEVRDLAIPHASLVSYRILTSNPCMFLCRHIGIHISSKLLHAGYPTYLYTLYCKLVSYPPFTFL